MKPDSLLYSLFTVALIVPASLQADTVWDHRYEEYVDPDMSQTIVCAQKVQGSSELVWSDNYEEYVPRNLPRHVIEEEQTTQGNTRLVYKPEYEEYVPSSLDGLSIASVKGCPIS